MSIQGTTPTVAVRLEGGLGDHILGMRLLFFIRQRYPRHQIVVYSDAGGHEAQLEIARMSPFVSRVEPLWQIPHRATQRTQGCLENLTPDCLTRMRQADVFLDAWGINWLIPQARELGVPYLEVLAHRPELLIPDQATAVVRRLLPALQNRVCVGLNVAKYGLNAAKYGAVVVRRVIERWRTILEALLEDPRVVIVNFLTSRYRFPHFSEPDRTDREAESLEERQVAEALGALSDRIVPCRDQPIAVLAALLSVCRYFWGVDNGVKHLAWALDVPLTYFVDADPPFPIIARVMPDVHRLLVLDCPDADLERHLHETRRALNHPSPRLATVG